MEFDFSIDDLFPNRVTVLTPPLLKRLVQRDVHVKERYKTVIDALGKSSAQAQALPTVITLFNKFLISDPTCQLFVLRDEVKISEAEAVDGAGGRDISDEAKSKDVHGTNAFSTENLSNPSNENESHIDEHSTSPPSSSRKGTVLGFLKVGPKDLFLHNEVEELVKVRPLCVLDFYVNESCQRQGCGKILFDFMLDCLNDLREGGGNYLEPRHLAYDRPSTKLLPFLKKHYGLAESIPQFNKFFIATGFFASDNPCWDKNNNNRGRNANDGDFVRSRDQSGRMTHSKSGGFFPYAGSRGGAAGGGMLSPGGESREFNNPKVKRWFSDDAVAAEGRQDDFWPFGGGSSKMRITPDENGPDRDVLKGLENVAIGPAGNQSGRFSRHFTAPHSQQREPQPPAETQNKSLLPNQPSNSARAPSSLMFGPPEAEPERRGTLTSESRVQLANDSRMSLARDWAATPRIPIGSEISNPGGRGRRCDPLSPSSPSVSNAFIWMPSTSPVNHRTRAPFATTSVGVSATTTPGFSSATPTMAPSSARVNGNKRFQRTSLW